MSTPSDSALSPRYSGIWRFCYDYEKPYAIKGVHQEESGGKTHLRAACHAGQVIRLPQCKTNIRWVFPSDVLFSCAGYSFGYQSRMPGLPTCLMLSQLFSDFNYFSKFVYQNDPLNRRFVNYLVFYTFLYFLISKCCMASVHNDVL